MFTVSLIWMIGKLDFQTRVVDATIFEQLLKDLKPINCCAKNHVSNIIIFP